MKIIDKLSKELPDYKRDVKRRHAENAKSMRFSTFIQSVFGIKPEDLDYEVPTDSTILHVKGRIDITFDKLIIEFKKDLDSQIEEAKTALKKYFQAYLEKSEINFLGVATDGIKFIVFGAITKNNEVVELKELNSLNIDDDSIEEIFLWFDSHFFAETQIVPTSKDIKFRFGLESSTFFTVCDKLEKNYALLEGRGDRRAYMKYSSWGKYLEIVYGSKPKDKTLFFKHTYLSTLVKLIIHIKITKNKPSTYKDLFFILQGKKFEKSGILDFMEDDFYTWVLLDFIKDDMIKLFWNLLKEIYVYDLERISEDVLKELYQELIDTEVKQSLGEFYTPDWLADTIVKDVVDKPESRILDPSCGSGTFLFKIIQFKHKQLLEKNWSDTKILEHILENVVGFDIHPLAVMIAKTNYLLALGDLVHSKRKSLSIPIYLSDSLKIPHKKCDISTQIITYEFEAINKTFHFPIEILKDITEMDRIIGIIKENGLDYQKFLNLKSKNFNSEEFIKNTTNIFKNQMLKKHNEAESLILTNSLKTLYELIESEMDTVWPYILRNMYKPISMTLKKADVILGNPPWITMRNIKNVQYQNFIKDQSKKYGLNVETKIIPHIEIAALFFCHVSNSYLNDHGKIAFIMPRSILVASHHENFLKFLKPQMKLEKIYDLSNSTSVKVTPLFKIPSCVIFCLKDVKTEYPIMSTIFNGKLSMFNTQMNESNYVLKKIEKEFSPLRLNESQCSYYYNKFIQGATITPSTIWKIEINDDQNLGFNPECPYVKTVKNNAAHMPWKKIIMEGNVEHEFLFTSISSKMIIPFGYLNRQLVLLPILSNNGNGIKMIKDHSQIEIQNKYISEYLEDAEKHWNDNRTQNNRSKSLYEYLNYYNKLIKQNPIAKFKVLYVAYGTYMTSCVINASENYILKINKTELNISGVFVDSTAYHFDANSLNEAHYLCSILNSKYIDKLIKPYQPKGDFGAWAIHRIPLRFSIPVFDSNNELHNKLTELGQKCASKIPDIVKDLNITDVGKIRSVIRNKLNDEYDQIDNIVKIITNES